MYIKHIYISYHRLNVYEFEEAPGVGDGQGSTACCSPWGHKESDMTERLNWSYLIYTQRHTHTILLLSIKKQEREKGILPCMITWQLPEGFMLSEVGWWQTNTVWFHLHVESENQNKWTKITKQKQTHANREQTGSCWRGGGWGDKWTRWGRWNFQL